MWHNVASSHGFVKHFNIDHYEKYDRDNGDPAGHGQGVEESGFARAACCVTRRANCGAARGGIGTAKPRGRPLSFDRDAALEAAMHVFWEHGYESASISDLTAAMGITPPSLYTAFGDKERLFLQAIERYGKGPGSYGQRALAEEPTARAAIERLLNEAAVELTQPCHPLGCMMVMATTNCSVAAEHVQNALAKRRALGVGSIEARIQRGIDAGEMPAETDAGALANFIATIYQGMSMQAKDGASQQSLLASAAMAMRSWPGAALGASSSTSNARAARPRSRAVARSAPRATAHQAKPRR